MRTITERERLSNMSSIKNRQLANEQIFVHKKTLEGIRKIHETDSSRAT
jgi:hypothetical protein